MCPIAPPSHALRGLPLPVSDLPHPLALSATCAFLSFLPQAFAHAGPSFLNAFPSLSSLLPFTYPSEASFVMVSSGMPSRPCLQESRLPHAKPSRAPCTVSRNTFHASNFYFCARLSSFISPNSLQAPGGRGCCASFRSPLLPPYLALCLVHSRVLKIFAR